MSIYMTYKGQQTKTLIRFTNQAVCLPSIMKDPWQSFFRDPEKLKAWLELGTTLASLIVKVIRYFS